MIVHDDDKAALQCQIWSFSVKSSTNSFVLFVSVGLSFSVRTDFHNLYVSGRREIAAGLRTWGSRGRAVMDCRYVIQAPMPSYLHWPPPSPSPSLSFNSIPFPLLFPPRPPAQAAVVPWTPPWTMLMHWNHCEMEINLELLNQCNFNYSPGISILALWLWWGYQAVVPNQ